MGPLKESGPNKQGREGARFRAALPDGGRTDHPKDIFTIRMLFSEREEIGMENVQSSRNVGKKRECEGYCGCFLLDPPQFTLSLQTLYIRARSHNYPIVFGLQRKDSQEKKFQIQAIIACEGRAGALVIPANDYLSLSSKRESKAPSKN